MSGPRHPGTEGNDLRPADIKFPDPDGGDGRLSLVNDVAAEFSGLAISNTQPGDMPDGGVWVNLSAEPTGIDRIQTYDESTDAFIPISADRTIVSEERPEPEIGLLWFEPVDDGANLYASSSKNWEFLQFIANIPDYLAFHDATQTDATDGAETTIPDLEGDADLVDGNKPTYDESGINGNAAFDFSDITEGIGIDDYPHDLDQPITVVSVHQTNTTGEDRQTVWDWTSPSGGSGAGLFTDEDGENRIFGGNSLRGDVTTTTDPEITIAVFDGENSVYNRNGDEITGDAGERSIGDIMRVGSETSSSFDPIEDGYVGFLGLIDGILDSEERGSEVDRLADKFDLNLD